MVNGKVNPVRTGTSRPIDGSIALPSTISISTADRGLWRSNGVKNNKDGWAKALTVALLSIFLLTVLAAPSPSAAVLGLGFVPTAEVEVLPVGAATISTGLATTKLNLKSISDALLTGLLKTAINMLRDMVLNWVITGRFEGPVFSTSFSADAKKIAENASRIFLSQLSGINFCAGFNIPSQPSLSLNLALGLECSLPTSAGGANTSNVLDMYLYPERYSEADLFFAAQPENLYPWVLTRTIEAKANAEARALIAFAAEYAAGQGFLGIRDENGNIVTPGSYVAELVMQNQIVSPTRQTDVANTIQQAIASIINTAIRVNIERGLSAAFAPGGGSASGTPAPPSAAVIAQKISGAVARGRAFLAGVPGGGTVPPAAGNEGITPGKVAEMNEIISALDDFQIQLGAELSASQLRTIASEVDSLVLRLDTIMLGSQFCVYLNQSSPLCPPTP